MAEIIKAVKGFNPDMTCTPTDDVKFQYEVGETYDEKEADVCKKGFHACELPINVFRYYPPTKSVYHEVEMFGKIDSSESDKTCSSKIKIGAKINIAGIIKASIDIIRRKAEKESSASSGNYGNAASSGNYGNAASSGDYGNAASSGYKGNAASSGNKGNAASSGNCGNAASSGNCGNAASSGYKGNAASSGNKGNAASSGDYGNAASSGNYGNAASSGDYGNAASSGNKGNAASSGYCGNAASSGYYGNAASSGYCGNAASSGYYGNAASSGNCGNAASSGYKGNAASSGDYGNAASSGNCGNAASSGYRGSAKADHPNSCAIAWGPESKASGVKGSHIVLAEWESNGGKYWEEGTWKFKGATMVRVDGENIKENTWYGLKNGKVIEIKED